MAEPGPWEDFAGGSAAAVAEPPPWEDFTQHIELPQPNEWVTNLRRTANDAAFETRLAPEEETAFQTWKAKAAPEDSGADYDLRGAFKAGITPDPQTGHWPDKFKKPNHPTFSDQSIYATARPDAAGHWDGDKFIPPPKPAGGEVRGAADDPRFPSFPGFFFDPKIEVPRIEHEKDDAIGTRAAKSVTNVLGEFVSGMSSPAMLAAPLQMLVATTPEMIAASKERIEAADKTPPYSAERMEAALSVAGLIGGGAVGLRQGLKPKIRNPKSETIPEVPISKSKTEGPWRDYAGAEEVISETARFEAEARTKEVATATSSGGEDGGLPAVRPVETAQARSNLPAESVVVEPIRGDHGKGKTSNVQRPTSNVQLREEAARLEYMRELEAEARSGQAEQGAELKEAVIRAGGLPGRGSRHRTVEVAELEQTVLNPQRTERVPPNQIFRNNAPPIDELATRLRDQGFDVPTPSALYDLLDRRFRSGKEVFGQPAMAPAESYPFDPKRAAAAPIPPAASPPVRPGVTMVMDSRLPVTLARTAPGSAAATEVMNSLKRVMTTSGSVGEIRRGRFTNIARGIFKPQEEVVRLEHIDNVPTAVHETGHALMKQFYGTIKASGLKVLPISVRRELIAMGKALYGDRKPVAGYTGEGFAEFIRHYLTTDDARTIAPNTNRFFESQVLPKYPEVAKELQASRALIDTYRMQGAMARANAQLVREPAWTRRVLKGLREFFSFQKFAESGMPLRELSQEAAWAKGKSGTKPGDAYKLSPLRPSEDPYKLFKMKRGASGAILDRMVENGMVDVWGNPTGGPSLREVFEPVRKKKGELLLYLFARRAEERWSKGKNPGITKEDAAYIRQTLESAELDLAARKYYQWWDGVLDYVVQADPRMAETVAAIKQGSSDYAPLARMLDETAVRREVAMAQSNPLYRMHGSGLPVKNIFDQTLVGAARLISRANRALVTNAIMKVAQIEGMGRWIEEVPVAKVQRTLNVEQIRGDLEALGMDTSKLPEEKVLEYFTPAEEPRGSDPIVPYKGTDGVTRWYHVDPKLYDTLNAIEPFSLRSIPHIGVALDLALGAPKRIFTLGTTGLRASFSLVTNPLRDPQGWFLQTKAGINPPKMLAAYFQAVGEQLRSAAGGKEGPISQAAFNLGPQMSQPLGRDINYTKRASNALFHGRLMRVVKSPIDYVRQELNLPESFPRLAEFKRVGEEIGWKPGEAMTPDQAVELSIAFKEATVDFSASGDISRIMNEMVPFFNPTMQGARTAARAFRDHPLRTTLFGLATLTGPTLLLWWQNKDKEWYRNLPWRERYYYNNIDDGKKVWQIPRPFEWGNLFQVIPEAAADSWYRRDPEAAKQALGHIFETQTPSVMPVLLRVAKEQWQNRLDFWDRPIVPKSEVDLPPGAQFGPYSSRVAMWLGKAFPDQLSPRRIDAAIRATAGGAVPDFLDLLGLGAQKKTRESELADTPVVGRLWRRGGIYNAQSQHLADFWDIKENVTAKAKAIELQLNDPQRARNVPINDPAFIMARDLARDAEDITFILQIANRMRESAGRQRLYRQAAETAKAAVDLHRKQEENLAQQRAKSGQ